MTHTGFRWVDKVRKNEGMRERKIERKEVRFSCMNEGLMGGKSRNNEEFQMYTHLIIKT